MRDRNEIEMPLLGPKGYDRKNDVKIDVRSEKESKGLHKSHFIEYLDPSSDNGKYAAKPPFLQWLTFTDMLPYVKRMNLMFKTFEIENMPNPDLNFNVESKLVKLDYYWTLEQEKPEPKFYRALYKTFLKEVLSAIFLVFIDSTTKIFYSIYMGNIVSIITSKGFGEAVQTEDLVSSATFLTFMIVLSIFAKNWAFFTMQSNVGRAKLAISGLLYKKIHSTSITSLHEIKLGKVINLIGNDLNDMQGLMQVPNMVINPYMVGLAMYMMWGYFGAACLLGLAAVIGVIILQINLSNQTEVPRRENKKTIDERVKLTHEIIEAIRLIKMYAWEKLFQKKIEKLREYEHKTFTKMAHIDAIGRNFSSMSVYLNILLLCMVYTAFGGILSPEKIYASMMILMFLSTSLVSSHQGRMGLVNFKMIIGRVEEVLTIKDILSYEDTQTRHDYDGYSKLKPVVMKNFTGYWNHTSQKPCLSDISITCKPGELTTIIGKIGSGKSSLLLSFLKELPKTEGKIEFNGRIAYVEQDPIIFSGTFKENILFGRDYDEALYKQVLKDCKLDADLQEFPFGDLTRIGERGVNLSGGQKARVSLARALYSQSDIFLLDDPFSALDGTVAREIFDGLSRETLRNQKVTILVTHHINFAKESDHVILMSDGKVEAQGTFAELEQLNLNLLTVFKFEDERKDSNENENESETKQKKKSVKEVNVDKALSKKAEKGQREESAEVTWSTYKNYLGRKDSRNEYLFLIFLFLTPHILIIYYGRFLGEWAEDHLAFSRASTEGASFNHFYYIFICLLLLCIIFVLSYTKAMRVNKFFLTTNTELHGKIMDILIKAQTLFFDVNPVGRVLNRFSNDLGVLDKGNPRMMYEFVDGAISHISLLVTVCVINPPITLPAIFVLYGLYQARKFFEKPMMLTKKLELASKSPMLSCVPSTIHGLIIIRAYNQGGRLLREFMDMIYANAKTFTFLSKITRLFAFVLDTPIQLLTIIGIWIFIFLMSSYNIEPGLVGLSLMYLLKIGSQSTAIIRQSLQVDINMQSAQRILDYLEIKSEAPAHIPERDSQVPRGWPLKGQISFRNVYLKYKEGLNYALKGLNLDIPSGLKVACVGRTGAGKSSIIQALFRMVEIDKGLSDPTTNGQILIDGVDIQTIGLHLLRSSLAIIPQVPVVFAGTIKRNLDPFEKLDEKELWNVLEEVGLKEYVSSLPLKLETDITVSNTVFSAGQKQLMCLARVIISKSKVIILDEATANVDIETDNFIQKTISEKFNDCTIITIAHRLITIADYDKVFVVDNGNVVEYDTPYGLLVERIGDDQITKTSGLFSEMVRNSGKSMSEKIFQIAKDHYYETKK